MADYGVNFSDTQHAFYDLCALVIFDAAHNTQREPHCRLRLCPRRRGWLRTEGLSVKAVAERAQYPDIFSFSRAFRRVPGYPPSSMRNTDQ